MRADQHQLSESFHQSSCLNMLDVIIQGCVVGNKGRVILNEYGNVSSAFPGAYEKLYFALLAIQDKKPLSADQVGALGRLSIALFKSNPDSITNNAHSGFVATL